MSSRIPLQIISTNTPDYTSSTMYEPYYNCCHYENQSVSMENSYQTPYMNFDSMSMSTSIESNNFKKKSTKRRSKHIPHHLRPQHVVERRNRRERLRVQDVNQAFYMLQQLLPLDLHSTTTHNNNNNNNNDDDDDEQQQQLNIIQNSSRISKVRTLRKAVDYIEALQQMLNENN
ncbi:unnamed protein product [Rotaria socialis]|uniref:BHLH domain-containing protein n=1 Tax=Rotaria socialis TaxID=392032 RepID=A0A820LV30_9BILA|nr:unnamed protein product [Rotaria socialis]CAF4362503.1 unnamed protein product [Rotaria socialis]